MEEKKYYPQLLDATIEDLAKHFDGFKIEWKCIGEKEPNVLIVTAGKFTLKASEIPPTDFTKTISRMCALLINKLEIPAIYYECKAKYSIPLMNSIAEIFEIKVGRNDGEFMYFGVSDKGVAYELSNHIEVYEAAHNDPNPPQ